MTTKKKTTKKAAPAKPVELKPLTPISDGDANSGDTPMSEAFADDPVEFDLEREVRFLRSRVATLESDVAKLRDRLRC